MAERAHSVVERLQMLLLLVSFQSEFGAEQFAADITAMGGHQGKGEAQSSGCPPGTHNTN